MVGVMMVAKLLANHPAMVEAAEVVPELLVMVKEIQEQQDLEVMD
jgi:hypothetical protein